MKKLFLILFVGLILSSCTHNHKKKEVINITNELLERNNYVITDSIFDFFPDQSQINKGLNLLTVFENAKKTKTPLLLSEFDPVLIIEVYKIADSNLFKSLTQDHESRYLYKVKVESKDYFIIESEQEMLKRYDSLTIKINYLNSNEKIIISFKKAVFDNPTMLNNSNYCCLSDGYEVFVLKRGFKFILDEEHKYEWTLLPSKIKHGYLSGVAFKEDGQYIIYWASAW